ncbi:MAG TPA: sigma 54-interacting transcriptional regulator [Candidatus Acidoferrales bacterium]|nr:sigma 54-interacting transcriptional regulator [Candidatus Acidoferrales bacterium]
MKEVINIIDKSRENMVIPDGIAVIGQGRKIMVFNEAASRITGYGEEEIVGKQCDILFRNSAHEVELISRSLIEGTGLSNLSINITDKRGQFKNVLASITPIGKSGEVTSVVFVFRDTKEMLTLHEELETKTLELIDQRNRLNAIFNSNIEGTFTIDNDWNVTSFNNSAEKITGYRRSEAIGRKCWEIFKSPLCRNGCHMEQTIMKGRPTIGNDLEITKKDGMPVPIRVNSAILLNNKQERIGAVETFIDISELKNLSDHLKEKFRYENIIGKNKEIERVFSLLDSVSQTDSTVLITGESGTGKELVARAIHLNSPRRNGTFVALNCSAFVESLIESELFGHEKGSFTGAIKTKIGKFELAQDGTLFLDEIGDISLPVQTKLLRVLETRQFERVGGNRTIKMNARIIAATNKSLQDEIEVGRFREDLFYRINVVNIHLPPLRERMDDFPLLVSHFITHFNERFSRNVNRFSPDAFKILAEYDWPGNVRELENVIEHSFVLCGKDVIGSECVPERIKVSDRGMHITNPSSIKEAETSVIITTLKKHGGSRVKAAAELGIHPSTLWRKMKKLGI